MKSEFLYELRTIRDLLEALEDDAAFHRLTELIGRVESAPMSDVFLPEEP